MGRLRSLLQRFIKPAAMVGAVGVLSLSLVVTTPTNAQAFQAPPVAPPVIAGAFKTVAPAALAVASVTPVGFALRTAGTLGWLAFSTSDMWMPYITGTFGQGKDDTEAAPVAQDQPYILQGLRIEFIEMQGRYAYLRMNWRNNYKAPAWTTAAYLNCRTSSGATSQVNQTVTGGSNAPASITSYTLACPEGQEAVGAVAGPGGAHTAFPTRTNAPGPENVRTAGTYSPAGFDPRGADTKYKVRSECIDAGGNKSFVEAETNGDVGALKMPSCGAAGKGVGTGVTEITALAPGTTVPQPVWTQPTPYSDPATPLCTPGKSSGCELSVELDGKPCTAGNVECENWSEINKNDPNSTRLKCKLGPYTLTMAQCAMLERAYTPGGSPATEANTDGNPDTRSNTDPNGNTIPAPAPNTTGTAPGSSGQPAPGDSKNAKCWPSGWGIFSPTWITDAMRCVFEPSYSLDQRTGELTEKAKGKAPISFLSLEMVGPSGGGCPNWVISVPGFSQNVVCGSSFTSAILSIRAPLFGLLATAMVWPLLRSLWYAAIPVLRVTPSSSGDK